MDPFKSSSAQFADNPMLQQAQETQQNRLAPVTQKTATKQSANAPVEKGPSERESRILQHARNRVHFDGIGKVNEIKFKITEIYKELEKIAPPKAKFARIHANTIKEILAQIVQEFEKTNAENKDNVLELWAECLRRPNPFNKDFFREIPFMGIYGVSGGHQAKKKHMRLLTTQKEGTERAPETLYASEGGVVQSQTTSYTNVADIWGIENTNISTGVQMPSYKLADQTKNNTQNVLPYHDYPALAGSTFGGVVTSNNQAATGFNNEPTSKNDSGYDFVDQMIAYMHNQASTIASSDPAHDYESQSATSLDQDYYENLHSSAISRNVQAPGFNPFFNTFDLRDLTAIAKRYVLVEACPQQNSQGSRAVVSQAPRESVVQPKAISYPANVNISSVPEKAVVFAHPKSSNVYFYVECPLCKRLFDSAGSIFYHLVQDDIAHLTLFQQFNVPKKFIGAMQIAGHRVFDATPELVAAHNNQAYLANKRDMPSYYGRR